MWRVGRRLGLTESEADLAASEVFAAAGERIGDIRPSSARGFLFSKSLHVTARIRRERGEQSAAISDRAPALEDLDESAQAREILSALLEQMPLELRVVFVLHEIEELAQAEIADIVGIPLAMVSSRLIEARDDFATHLETESELSQSLRIAAREEAPPAEALLHVLRAAGVEAVKAEPATAAPSAAATKLARSPLLLATTWLLYGLIAGFVLATALYAVGDAVASSSKIGNSGAPP